MNIVSCESVTYVEEICVPVAVVRAPHCSGGQNRLLRRDGQSRQGGKVALCVWEKFIFTSLTDNVDVVKSPWVRVGEWKTKKMSLWVSVLNYPARMIA